MESTLHLVPRLRGGGDPLSTRGASSSSSGLAGFAAGGRISQQVNRDQWPHFAYDDAIPTRLHVTVINASHFTAMIGLPAPPTPISTATYIQHGSPWFTFYDEQVPAAKINYGLANVQSVATLDAERDARGEARPQQECVFCVYGKAASASTRAGTSSATTAHPDSAPLSALHVRPRFVGGKSLRMRETTHTSGWRSGRTRIASST